MINIYLYIYDIGVCDSTACSCSKERKIATSYRFSFLGKELGLLSSCGSRTARPQAKVRRPSVRRERKGSLDESSSRQLSSCPYRRDTTRAVPTNARLKMIYHPWTAVMKTRNQNIHLKSLPSARVDAHRIRQHSSVACAPASAGWSSPRAPTRRMLGKQALRDLSWTRYRRIGGGVRVARTCVSPRRVSTVGCSWR